LDHLRMFRKLREGHGDDLAFSPGKTKGFPP
jgi:hypothetical protein